MYIYGEIDEDLKNKNKHLDYFQLSLLIKCSYSIIKAMIA